MTRWATLAVVLLFAGCGGGVTASDSTSSSAPRERPVETAETEPPPASETAPPPVVASELRHHTLALGGGYSCVMRGERTVRCWGSFRDLSPAARAPAPWDVELPHAARGLEGGRRHWCALLVDGTAHCVGQNADLALGAVDPSASVNTVRGAAGALTDLACGWLRSFAVSEGGVLGWGTESQGATVVARRAEPTPIEGLSNVDSVSAGAYHACARTGDGQVWCWGASAVGAPASERLLGQRRPPTRIEGLTDVVELASGGHHACARTRAGRVSCWGENRFGQLGNGSAEPYVAEPRAVPIEGVVQLALGASHTCALTAAGRVFCWGSNGGGALGDGTTEDRRTPTAATGLDAMVEVVAGYAHSCARRSDGAVFCWGANHRGQLGDGTVANRPRAVRAAPASP